MRTILQKIFRPFFVWLANRLAAAPKQRLVFRSLSHLYNSVSSKKSKRGIVLKVDINTDKFIIFSDQHKGNKDPADDFMNNEGNYIAALDHYRQQGYSYINLGDAEELWKYNPRQVIPSNTNALKAEAAFQNEDKYYRTFGNHDLLWKNRLDVELLLKHVFQMPLPVYEGIILQTNFPARQPVNIFLTHGHQGDKMSDNNRFSTWIVAHIWSPIQRYLQININTPAKDFHLRNKHNQLMYEWSSRRKDLLLITGHTHNPVFASGKYTRKNLPAIDTAENSEALKPSYFNTGCCCFSDGDITGIEIADGSMRLVKWHSKNNIPSRIILEEKRLEELLNDL